MAERNNQAHTCECDGGQCAEKQGGNPELERLREFAGPMPFRWPAPLSLPSMQEFNRQQQEVVKP